MILAGVAVVAAASWVATPVVAIVRGRTIDARTRAAWRQMSAPPGAIPMQRRPEASLPCSGERAHVG